MIIIYEFICYHTYEFIFYLINGLKVSVSMELTVEWQPEVCTQFVFQRLTSTGQIHFNVESLVSFQSFQFRRVILVNTVHLLNGIWTPEITCYNNV